MRRLIIFVLVALALMGTSAYAYAQVVREPQPLALSAEPEPDELDVPTVLEDWCMFMTQEFGPGRRSPSVVSAVNAMISRTPTDHDNYLALLEGEPANIAATYAVVRTAAQQSLGGQAPSNAPQALSAAGSIDTYLQANCGG